MKGDTPSTDAVMDGAEGKHSEAGGSLAHPQARAHVVDLRWGVLPLMEADDTAETGDMVQVLAFGDGHGETPRNRSPLGIAVRARRKR